MDLSNLKEIIKIQSEIIKRLGREFADNHLPTQEKQEMLNLLDDLKNKLKGI